MPSSNELSSRGANHPTGYTRNGCRPPPPCRAASPYSRLDHVGFGSYMSDLQPVTTARLVLTLRDFGFPMRIARHSHKLLGSCFEKYDPTSVLLRGPFMLNLIVAMQFQALLTPVSGCFSVFPLGT